MDKIDHTGYRPTWLVKTLHSMPHLDFSLELVNSTFNFGNVKYKESLIFWASLPVLMLLLILMSLLAYLVFRCICKLRYDEENDEVESRELSLQGIQNCLSCLRWTCTSLAIIGCGMAGVGFYGNRLINKGLYELIDSFNYVGYSAYMSKNQLILLKSGLARVSRGISEIRTVLTELMNDRNGSMIDFNYYLTEMTKAMEHNKEVLNLKTVVALEYPNYMHAEENMRDALSIAKHYEFYRWLVMIVVFSWLIFLFLVLLIAIAKNSKCMLLIFCSFGILSLVASCLSASIHLAIAISVSDFCRGPETSVVDILSYYMDKDLATYYIKCDPVNIVNPFKEHFERAQINLLDVQTYAYHTITNIEKLFTVSPFSNSVTTLSLGISEVNSCIVKLLALNDCYNINNDYQAAVKGVCLSTLPGITMVVLLCFFISVFLTILIFLVIKLWRVFRPLHDSFIKTPQSFIDSMREGHMQRGESSGSLCRQYAGLINPSDSCGAIRESIA